MGKIIMIAAREGCGKTYETLNYYAGMRTMHEDSKPAVLIDTEYKADLTYDTHFKDMPVEIVQCQEFDVDVDKGIVNLNLIKTLNAIRDEVRKAIKLGLRGEVGLIIFDSMVGLRTPFCEYEWEHEAGKKAMSPDAWKQINDKVREIVFPLTNIAKLREHVDVIITAAIIDRYEVIDKRTGVSQIVGEELGVKDWLAFQVQYIVELQKNKKKLEYTATVTKSPRGMFELDHATLFNKSGIKWDDKDNYNSLYYHLL